MVALMFAYQFILITGRKILVYESSLDFPCLIRLENGEKQRCEVATFAWIQEHCPHVPMLRLWGFGFVDG
jgi:hypothetical protein